MLKFEVLILETRTPNGPSTCAISSCEISSLDHEIGDDPMKFAACECELFVVINDSSLAECDKILDCFWHFMPEHVYHDVSGTMATDVYGECHSMRGVQL
jgi:hypothetical protein